MFQDWTLFDITHNASRVLCIIGFFGYVNEVIQGRVGRYTRWSELNVMQWIFVVLSFQLPVFIIVTAIARTIAGA